MTTSNKVTAEHLRRLAYLYIRQSTLRQVHENRESTARQYDLKRRAQALGWVADQIIVIDEDMGLSGATATNRNGILESETWKEAHSESKQKVFKNVGEQKTKMIEWLRYGSAAI